MQRALLASCLLAFSVPAIADSTPTFEVELSLSSGKQTRQYTVKVLDHGCSNVRAKANLLSDEIKVCVDADGAKARLHIDWLTRDGEREIQNKSSALIARGAKLDLNVESAQLTASLK